MTSTSKSEDRVESVAERRITIGDPNTTTDDDRLVATLKGKLQIEPLMTRRHCIFRVPERLRNINEDAFTPQAVSIGPFHRDKLGQFKAMENYKSHYLNAILGRHQILTLNYCVNTLKGLEERARGCYAEAINLKSDEFVEMMLLDGCFIIEFLLRHSKLVLRDDYDPLFDNIHFQSAFEDDLLILENQLPFFVLKDLFDLINNAGPTKLSNISFLELTHKYFEGGFHTPGNEPAHLLDLVLQKYIPSNMDKNKGTESAFTLIPSATLLREAGVKFVPAFNKHLLDIKFENGILEIPVINVEDQTEPLFRNMIAFEQYYSKTTWVCDYTTLMDHLIDSPSDVALLRKKEIITNWLGDDEEVSTMFNKLGKNVSTSKDFQYIDLYNSLNHYAKTPWHRWKTTLKHDYFNTPWSTIAFAGAAIGVICTIIQTVFIFGDAK